MYLLNLNIFIVFGNKKALIYDLQEKFANLIWLDEKETISIKKLFNNPKYRDSFVNSLINNSNYSVLQEALYLGVLRSSNTRFLTKKAQKKPIFRVLELCQRYYFMEQRCRDT